MLLINKCQNALFLVLIFLTFNILFDNQFIYVIFLFVKFELISNDIRNKLVCFLIVSSHVFSPSHANSASNNQFTSSLLSSWSSAMFLF